MGTWKAGISIVHTGIRHPSSVMKNVIPIVMAGVIGIYGLIVGVILGQAIVTPTNDRNNVYSTYTGMAHLCAGLCCGISGLAAGLCIGIVGDYGIRAVGYRASQITLFPTDKEAAGYSTIPDEDAGGDDISGVSCEMLRVFLTSNVLNEAWRFMDIVHQGQAGLILMYAVSHSLLLHPI